MVLFRAAGRFDDYIQDENDPCMRSVTPMDGIRGWRDAGEEYIQLMDEYQEQMWHKWSIWLAIQGPLADKDWAISSRAVWSLASDKIQGVRGRKLRKAFFVTLSYSCLAIGSTTFRDYRLFGRIGFRRDSKPEWPILNK